MGENFDHSLFFKKYVLCPNHSINALRKMDFREIRIELKKMSKVDLFKLVVNQRISKCVIKDGFCPLLFKFKNINFCVSELMGQSCEDERVRKLEQRCPVQKELSFSLPLRFEKEFQDVLEFSERGVEFKVYYKNHLSSSMILIGKIVERRRRERGNNLRDLLNKAIREFSNCVKDSSSIFIVGNLS